MKIEHEQLIDYCKKTADTHNKLLTKTLNADNRATWQNMDAIAYFMQKEEMYRYLIPALIEGYVEDLVKNKIENGDVK